MAPPTQDELTAERARHEDPELKSDVRLLKFQVELLDKKLDKFFDEVKNQYATKAEVKDVRDDVAALNSNISWAIKIVIGAVLIGVLGLIISKGGTIPR